MAVKVWDVRWVYLNGSSAAEAGMSELDSREQNPLFEYLCGRLYRECMDIILRLAAVRDGKPGLSMEEYQAAVTDETSKWFSALPPAHQTLYAARCIAQHQYMDLFQWFAGTTESHFSPEVVAGLEEIGFPRIARVVERANRWFGPVYPRNPWERMRRLGIDVDHWVYPDASLNPFKELYEEFQVVKSVELKVSGCEDLFQALERHTAKGRPNCTHGLRT